MKNLIISILSIMIVMFNFLLLTVNCSAQTPEWIWAKCAGGSSSEAVYSVAVDNDNNVIITGWFNSSNLIIENDTIINAGSEDVFVIKYDSIGNLMWAKGLGGNSVEIGNSVVIDDNNNIIVTGMFYSPTITFGGYTLVNTYAYSGDIFIVKYDASGNTLWAKNAGGISNDIGISITTDGTNNIIVTGYFQSPSIIFGNDSLINTSPGFNDIFIAKYDPLGNVLWAKSGNGSELNLVQSISTDTKNNIIITGYFVSSSIVFGNDTLVNTNSGSSDLFLIKYDSLGNVIWAKSSNGNAYESGNYLTTDNSDNIIVTGAFNSTSISLGNYTLINPNDSSSTFFVVKFDEQGNVLWAKCAGGNQIAGGYSVTSVINSQILVSGFFNSSIITFDSDTLINSFAGNQDVFIVKYDAIGNVIWAKSVGGTFSEQAYMCNDLSGNIYLAGNFVSHSVTFGTHSIINVDNSNQTADIFVAKLQDCNIITSITNPINVSCFGGVDGHATVTPSNGTYPYTYSWNTIPTQTTPTIMNISAGTYIVTVTDIRLCAVIDTVEITQPDEIFNYSSIILCDGQSYTFNGHVYTTAGIYNDTLYSIIGCDSIIVTNITINPVYFSNNTISICQGETYIFNNHTYTTTGIYSDTLQSLTGCDSIIITNLIVKSLAIIHGEALYSGGFIGLGDAQAILFKVGTNGNHTQVDSVFIDINGSFSFQNIIDGNYYVYVKLNNHNVPYQQVFNTYYDSTFRWQDAYILNLACGIDTNISIHMYEKGQTSTGNGYITGNIHLYSTQEGKTVGSPIINCEVYIERELVNELIANSETDTSGTYKFINLPIGSFTIYVDIPGLPLIQTYSGITVTQTDTIFTNLNFYVDTTSATAGIYTSENNKIINLETSEFSVKLFPNPVEKFLSFELNQNGKLTIEILDMNAKSLYKSTFENNIKVDMTKFSQGIYFVKLQSKNTVIIKKIIKQ